MFLSTWGGTSKVNFPGLVLREILAQVRGEGWGVCSGCGVDGVVADMVNRRIVTTLTGQPQWEQLHARGADHLQCQAGLRGALESWEMGHEKKGGGLKKWIDNCMRARGDQAQQRGLYRKWMFSFTFNSISCLNTHIPTSKQANPGQCETAAYASSVMKEWYPKVTYYDWYVEGGLDVSWESRISWKSFGCA